MQEAETAYKEKAEVFEVLQSEQEKRQQRAAALESDLEVQEETAHTAHEAYLSRNSLLQSLSELRKKFEGFGEGVKALAEAKTNTTSKSKRHRSVRPGRC